MLNSAIPAENSQHFYAVGGRTFGPDSILTVLKVEIDSPHNVLQEVVIKIPSSSFQIKHSFFDPAIPNRFWLLEDDKIREAGGDPQAL